MIREQMGHTPVATDRLVEWMAPALGRPGAVYFDATIGMGGHAAVIAERFPSCRIVGLDRDPAAIEWSSQRLGSRASLRRAGFAEIAAVAASLGLDQLDGILFDLGVSSVQLDSDERGFAYSRDTPLDMRMDPELPVTAADILATYSQVQLMRILRDYGEERFAGRIASRIVTERADRPLTHSGQLVELVRQAVPAPARRKGGNPAKRTFQALRIEVNGELDQIALALPAAIRLLRPGGRLVVMSYHSLEDAAVKRALRLEATSKAPPGLPVEPESAKPVLRILTRGAEPASASEIQSNPRSASLRLRAAEKIREMT
ncbi:MAG: 16S rRNA (cytosine(1402)-N(4))-methyltransferase RsmH [Bifidobacteriaceae bacterium]|nr:16S rRNA (cytosine(1402)-N(4))-methyltransferase RsmH [Bifidobacteriaceae bacterium]